VNRSGLNGIKGRFIFLDFVSWFIKTLYSGRFSWSRALGLGFALLCAGGYVVSARASSASVSGSISSPKLGSQFAIADFDGDRRLDLATVHVGQSNSWDTQYWIAFQLSGGSRQTLDITARTGGIQITSRDVNGDAYLDVIVTAESTNQAVAVLLNDGRGNFEVSSGFQVPGAFVASENSWVLATEAIQDPGIVPFPRYPSGICSAAGRFSTSQNVAGLLVLWTSLRLPFAPAIHFPGRAPPSS
jgi:hypothetical protein